MTKALATLAPLALTACVQFTGDELPELTVASLQKPKVAEVDYAFQTFSLLNNSSWLSNESAQRDLYEVVRSDMNSAFETINPTEPRASLHVDIEIGRNIEPSELKMIWLGVTWPTAFIIPYYNETEYWLDARVSWQGKPLETYRYDESIYLWAWLPLLPLMITNSALSRTPELKLVDKLVLNFLQDLSVDLEALPPITPPVQ